MAEYIMRMDPAAPEFAKLEGSLLRCADCEHHRIGATGAPYCSRFRHVAEAEGFCAWGRPREAE